MKKHLKENCVGCGLCVSMDKAVIKEDDRGFYVPQEGDEAWLDEICPASGNYINDLDHRNVWGKSEAVYYGYSLDTKLRKKASTGGVLTEIASYLLDSKQVDFIIHIKTDDENPVTTQVCLSSTREELIARCGSRYSISHPLEALHTIDRKKRYALIAKPCDMIAINNFIKKHSEFQKIIVYKLSFFCMGLPSYSAQKVLLKSLGSSVETCKTLLYRGQGWPGKATAENRNGTISSISYEESWGKILGRDVMRACRFCMDGVGELADITCADAWYLGSDSKPDFTEKDGRNIVFARNEKGDDLLKEMNSKKCINIVEAKEYIEYLSQIQKSQLNRKGTMFAQILAMKLCCKSTPKYNMKKLWNYRKYAESKRSIRMFLGIIKRVMQNKI